jgi:hypothetical protein
VSLNCLAAKQKRLGIKTSWKQERFTTPRDARHSPAGDAHVPCQRRALMPAIDDEIVALRLA